MGNFERIFKGNSTEWLEIERKPCKWEAKNYKLEENGEFGENFQRILAKKLKIEGKTCKGQAKNSFLGSGVWNLDRQALIEGIKPQKSKKPHTHRWPPSNNPN